MRKEDPSLRQTWDSILFGPAFSWWNKPFGRKLNCATLPLGACAMLRLDLQPAFASTPLLINGKKKARANTALANKSLLNRSAAGPGPDGERKTA